VEAVQDKPAETPPAKAEPAAKDGKGRVRAFFDEHPWAKWALPLILVLLIVGGIIAWMYYSVRESTDDAQISGHIIPVSARVGGFVQEVPIEQNQEVKAGALLFRIDPAVYQIAVEHAKADLADAQAAARGAHVNVPITSTTVGSRLSNTQAAAAAAQAAVGAAQKQIEGARAQEASKQAHLQQAQTDYENAARDVKRYEPLVKAEEISRQVFDASVTKANSLKAAADVARADVAAAGQTVGIAQSNLSEARARLAEAEATVRGAQTGPQQIALTEANAGSAAAKVMQRQAALDQAELNLQYATVRAPVDGVIGEKNVEVGMNVQPAQSLLSIVPLNDIWITANFKEDQLHKMRPGQKVTITVDAYGGRKYDGYVESVAPATGERFSVLPPENATGNYVKVVQRIPVRLRFDKGQDPQHLLRPGMSVVATVILK
jgi:membrane fusion protein (multidrug efflux system)